MRVRKACRSKRPLVFKGDVASSLLDSRDYYKQSSSGEEDFTIPPEEARAMLLVGEVLRARANRVN